jgi:Na+-transporting NADH:ubiquinone oxidoreductase subunit NqrD
VNFITSNIVYIFLPFAIYRSDPWKLPIWTNLPVMGLVILNIVLLVPMSLFTGDFSFLGMVEVAVPQMVIIWVVMLVTAGIVVVVNKLIEKVFFEKMKRQLES